MGVGLARTWSLDGEVVEITFFQVAPAPPPTESPAAGRPEEEAEDTGPVLANRPIVRLLIPAEAAGWIRRLFLMLDGTVERVRAARLEPGGPVLVMSELGAPDLDEPDQATDRADGEAGEAGEARIGAETPLAWRDGALVIGEGDKAVRLRFDDPAALERVESLLRAARSSGEPPAGET